MPHLRERHWLTDRSRAGLAALLGAGLVLGAGPAGAADGGAAPGKPAAASTTARANDGVELLDAGQTPRRLLRTAAVAGQVERVTVALQLKMGLEMGSQKMPPTPVPTVSVTLELTPESVASGSPVRAQVRLLESTVTHREGTPAHVTAQMRLLLGLARGLVGHVTLHPDGRLRDVSLPLPGGRPEMAHFLDHLREALRHLILPTPDEPVGVGARWQVREAVRTQGARLTQRRTFTLRALSDTSATIDTAVQQTARSQALPVPPGLPAGTTIQLTRAVGSGRGALTHTGGRLLAHGASTGELQLTATVAGPQATQTMLTTFQLSLDAARSEP